jgi:hypothetical protein
VTEWHEDPNVLSWDWRQQPDMTALARMLARHGVTLTEIETGSDQFAIRITGAPADASRREWAAALRWLDADWPRGLTLHQLAEDIERGATPWADTPEPSTPPAQQPATAPTAPDVATDTSGGVQAVRGVLGRAWTEDGDVTGAVWYAEPLCEVLLVDPRVGDVLAAALEWREASRRQGVYAEHVRALAAAVDALGDHPAEPMPASVAADIATVPDALADPATWPDTPTTRRWRAAAGPRPAEPAPEPDSGTGWNRERLQLFIDGRSHGGPEEARQVGALLADRDQGWALLAEVERKWLAQAARATAAERERDAARAELAEEKRDHAKTIKTWRVTAEHEHAEVARLEEELVAVRGQCDRLRELTQTCACGDGNPESFEGPQPDCPVHGAVRAFNEASRDLTEARAVLEAMTADRDRLREQHTAFSARLGFGDDVSEPAAALADMVDPLAEAMAAAVDHDECPVHCELCGEILAATVCQRCNGVGDVGADAYSECPECAGVGRIHEGCAERTYAELVAERNGLREQVQQLHRRDGVLLVKPDESELATVRRDAAADALVFGAGLATRWGQDDLAADMRLIAAEVRDGTRTVKPEPASGEDVS